MYQIKSLGLAYTSKEKLLEAIDELPKGMEWFCKEIVQEGDLKDQDGNSLTEQLEIWYRDPIECIKELIGNPIFKKRLAYAPVRHYRDRQGKERQVDEMWTGDWWWTMQVSENHEAFVTLS